uniref:Uncharacterized protein n=1 Tax=Ciona savignyi TaxID=51511 RepID=H2YHQ9_CIOSA
MVLGLAGVPALKCALEVSRPDVASTTAGFNQIPKNDPVELHRRMDHGHSGPHVHVHAELDSKPELDVEFVETMTTHNPKLVLQTFAADVFHGNNGVHAPYHAAWVSNNVSEPTFVQMANQLSPCCDFGWSGWSACCKNGNTLPDLQVRLRGNGCTQRWENVTRICPPGTRVLNIQCSNHNVLFASSEQRRRRRSVEVELP